MPSQTVQDPKQVQGPTVIIDPEQCKGCQLCTYTCPTSVLRIAEGLNHLGFHPAEYVGEGCTGCGICFYTCPEPGAIIVVKPPRKKK